MHGETLAALMFLAWGRGMTALQREKYGLHVVASKSSRAFSDSRAHDSNKKLSSSLQILFTNMDGQGKMRNLMSLSEGYIWPHCILECDAALEWPMKANIS